MITLCVLLELLHYKICLQTYINLIYNNCMNLLLNICSELLTCINSGGKSEILNVFFVLAFRDKYM